MLRWIPEDFTDDISTLVQVMAWCCQATSHYLSRCWPNFMSPYGITSRQWANAIRSLYASWRPDNSRKPAYTYGNVEFWPFIIIMLFVQPLSVVADSSLSRLWWSLMPWSSAKNEMATAKEGCRLVGLQTPDGHRLGGLDSPTATAREGCRLPMATAMEGCRLPGRLRMLPAPDEVGQSSVGPDSGVCRTRSSLFS